MSIDDEGHSTVHSTRHLIHRKCHRYRRVKSFGCVLVGLVLYFLGTFHMVSSQQVDQGAPRLAHPPNMIHLDKR